MKLLDWKVDKLLHFLVCYSITLSLSLFIGYYGAIVGILVGLGKELHDWFKYGKQQGWNTFWKDSKGDLIADFIGVIGGLIIWLTF